MFTYTKIVLTKYADFTGRARRAEYWYYVLAYYLFSFGLGFISGFTGISNENFSLIQIVISIALLIPSIAVGVRRVHDSNKSGWFLLVPFYNLYLLIRKGESGSNRFGDNSVT